MSPSYVGESTPSSERRLDASWCLAREETFVLWDVVVLLLLFLNTGTEIAEAASSVRGSLSSSDLKRSQN